MSLDDVAAERLAGPERRLDVDLVAGRETAERGSAERLRHGVERDLVAVDRDDRQADAADRDGVAERDARRGQRRGDPQADAGLTAVDPGDATALPHDAREHASRLPT